MKSKVLGVLAVGLLAGPMAAQAVPVIWTLNGTFLRGGTAEGAFVYDADGAGFSDIALTTSFGRTYTQFLEEASRGLIFLQTGVTEGATIALALDSITLSMLTNAGGVLQVNPSPGVAFFAEFSCVALAECAGGGGSSVTNWSPGGVSTLTGIPAVVPEPASLALLGLGLAGLGLSRRRKA